MRKLTLVTTITILSSILLVSCNKAENNILHTNANDWVEIPYAKLQSDSIANMMVEGEIMVFDQLSLDLDGDETPDIRFEVVDLTLWNGQMPEHLDHLAARAVLLHNNIQLVDNSTYGYPDALTDQNIEANSTWSSYTTLALGTIANAGKFEGLNNRYLGYRIQNGTDYHYGWVELSCSATSDVLTVESFAYNLTPNKDLFAGETE